MKSAPTIRIKLVSRGYSGTRWAKQLPKGGSFSGQCSFHFDLNETNYDWLVVVDDVSRTLRAKPERLPCADEHTLLVTTEPPTITRYGKGFSRQFTHVLTSQPEETLPHPGRIHSHTGNLWFHGRSYTDLGDQGIPTKTMGLSTVCSSKQQKHTIHNDRYRFCQWLMEQLPDTKLFGHGSKYVEHKYDALDPFRYHLAIENYSGLHHWTEKLADPYLSGCFPIYYGCTNVGDYFPEGSYLEIDIDNRREALEKIRSIVEDEAHYESHKPLLMEARHQVMTDYNMLNMVEAIVLKHYRPDSKTSGRPLYGRKQMRLRCPGDAISLAAWRIKRHLK